MYCQNTLEMHQKLIEALIDLKDSNSDDKEIICNHMLDKSPTSDLVNCLNLVQSLIKKELLDMKITELPSFVGFFLVDITKYGPWFLLQPKCPGLEKAKDGVIASLIEKLTDASSIDFALKFSSMIEMYFNNHISVKYQNFLQKNLSEARILKSLQERLSNKIQDFPYFQKFSRLQAKFLLEKFERTFEETQKSSQKNLTTIYTKLSILTSLILVKELSHSKR